MRNRTAIRLLYVLAVAAGVLPPILFLGFAFRQSVSLVERDLDFIGSGTIVRAENVIETIASTLRKVSTMTSDEVSEETLTTLRQAVFLNRYLQGISVRRGNLLLCSSEQLHAAPIDVATPPNFKFPKTGEFKILAPTQRGFPNPSVVMLYAFAPDRMLEGLVDPNVFQEFFDYYAREGGCRAFIYLDTDKPITSFGITGIKHPPLAKTLATKDLQWIGNSLVQVSQSTKFPIRVITVTPSSTVLSKWIRSATEFAIAGIVVAALLTALILRLARRTQSLEADLREAVRYGEIDIYYQPILNLLTGECAGCEALMRWHHPRKGLIPAGEFISIAEKTDLILPMTDVLLRKVVDELSELLQKNPELRVGLNLAAQHFASEKILQSVQQAFAGRIDPQQIIYEITERGLIADAGTPAQAVMQGLSKNGSKLAVDDFGTGYSSLSYLQRYNLDYLKIDKAFVDGIDNRETSSGLVDQIIRIAQTMKMEVIAEGVEHAYQADYLRAQGVQYAQGWHFGRPMPAADFLKFVRKINQAAAR